MFPHLEANLGEMNYVFVSDKLTQRDFGPKLRKVLFLVCPAKVYSKKVLDSGLVLFLYKNQ